jgi:hypothetical protein
MSVGMTRLDTAAPRRGGRECVGFASAAAGPTGRSEPVSDRRCGREWAIPRHGHCQTNGLRFLWPSCDSALDALRSNLPANSDLLIQALVTQSASASNSTTTQRALSWTIRDEGGLRKLPNSQRHQRDRRPVCLPHRLGIAVGGCQADSAALREPSMPGAARSWLGAADPA